jgi:hypothetical protein
VKLRAIHTDYRPTDAKTCASCNKALGGVEYFATVQNNGGPALEPINEPHCEACVEAWADDAASKTHHVWQWYADQFPNNEAYS